MNDPVWGLCADQALAFLHLSINVCTVAYFRDRAGRMDGDTDSRHKALD